MEADSVRSTKQQFYQRLEERIHSAHIDDYLAATTPLIQLGTLRQKYPP